jgi:hypothetical protein
MAAGGSSGESAPVVRGLGFAERQPEPGLGIGVTLDLSDLPFSAESSLLNFNHLWHIPLAGTKQLTPSLPAY